MEKDGKAYIKGLRIGWDSGEGGLKLPDEFWRESNLFQADVLKDWLYLIECEYENAVARMRKELAASRRAAEQIRQLKQKVLRDD